MRITFPQLLVHEYVSGGGWPQAELPAGLAAEGFAMLRAVLTDLKAWGAVRITTTLDHRLAGRKLPADRVVPLRPDEHESVLRRVAAECGAVLLIAPESDHVLSRLTALVESAGVQLLGSNAAAVALAADKWQSYQLFHRNGIPTPETWSPAPGEAPMLAGTLGYPLVVKPRYGAGAEGVSLVSDPAELERALDLAGRELLLQRFVPGVHASVSLLVHRGEVVPLSLNQQNIHVDFSFTYRGGCIPLEHPRAADALVLAARVASLIPGLDGYVGMDLVFTDDGPSFIEINPRLTTAYVGLRQVTDLNLAQAIWNTCRYGKLPHAMELTGRVAFNKDGTFHD